MQGSAGAIHLPAPWLITHTPPRIPAPKKSHYPLLSGNTFRCFCDYWADEGWMDFDPDAVKKGSTVFVNMKYINFFLETILPEIQNPFVLVSSSEHGTIDERYLPYLANEKIIHWFGENIILKHPKTSCIPLGILWAVHDRSQVVESYFKNLTLEKYFRDKPIYCYVNMYKSHPSRKAIVQACTSKPFCTISQHVPFEQYMEDLQNSRFVISPRGFNIDSFRTWEALYAGAIPVVESHGIDSIYEGLPIIIVEDLCLITQELLDEKFEELKKQPLHLERLHAQYWFDKIIFAQRSL